MAIHEGFVTPEPLANPTVKAGEKVPVAPISTWPIGMVSSVLVFPTALDQTRLEKALAKVASYWPSVAGRFVKSGLPNGPDFAIAITESPIPFSTQTTDDEYPYADKNVIQSDLGSYLPPLDPKFAVPDGDAPQVAIRLSTLKDGTSVLGVNWGHILGDARAFSRFIEDLALFYNMPYADLEEDMPTLSPHVDIPPATDEIKQKFDLFAVNGIPVPDMIKGYANAEAQSERITVILTRAELAHIVAERGAGEHLSDMDLITGWWITVLERAGIKLTDVVYTVNYRGFHKGHPAFPANLDNLGANVAQMRKIHLPPPNPDAPADKPWFRAATIARTVRHALNALRDDPDLTLAWLSNAADHLGEAGREGTCPLLVPPPGISVVNSNLRYDWAIKFGQPSANYHTDVSVLRFLRVFQANPRPGAEADGERDIELCFRAEWGKPAEQVRKVIKGDRERWSRVAIDPPAQEEVEEEPIRSFSMNQNMHRPAWGGSGN